MHVRFALVLVCLGITSCSLVPARLDSPIEIVGQMKFDHESKTTVESAEVNISRCFLPRSIVPVCEFVPLAKYKTTIHGRFNVLVYMKGTYRIEIESCVDGKEYWASETIKIVTGKETIESMLLRESYGQNCKIGI